MRRCNAKVKAAAPKMAGSKDSKLTNIPTGRYVSGMTSRSVPSATTRDRLLDAAVALVRQKGFAATSIDDLCRAAGVTKGAFFHHFASKEALGIAVADHWSAMTAALFADAPYHAPADPLDRVFAYLDFRRDLIDGGVAEFTCLVGTLVQEVHETSTAIADACDASISAHARTLEADIAAAMVARRVTGIDPASLALHTQAVLQGAFILAKARGGPEIARDTVAHLKRYMALLFGVKEGA